MDKDLNSLWYSCLENPMDGGVAKNRTGLSNFTFTFHFHALEKEMTTHSSVLAWRIPGMGEPVGLPSMGSHRIGHEWSDLAAATARTWTWANFRRWWGTGRPGVLHSVGSQRVGHDWMTEQQQGLTQRSIWYSLFTLSSCTLPLK